MNTLAEKTLEKKSQSLANSESQKQNSNESTFQFVDNRPEVITQRKLQEMANNSPQAAQMKALQEIANQSSKIVQLKMILNEVNAYPMDIMAERKRLKDGEGANPLSNFGILYGDTNKLYHTASRGPHSEEQMIIDVKNTEHEEHIFTERTPCGGCGPKLEKSKVVWNTDFYHIGRDAATEEIAERIFSDIGWVIWKGIKITSSDLYDFIEISKYNYSDYLPDVLDGLNVYKSKEKKKIYPKPRERDDRFEPKVIYDEEEQAQESIYQSYAEELGELRS